MNYSMNCDPGKLGVKSEKQNSYPLEQVLKTLSIPLELREDNSGEIIIKVNVPRKYWTLIGAENAYLILDKPNNESLVKFLMKIKNEIAGNDVVN